MSYVKSKTNNIHIDNSSHNTSIIYKHIIIQLIIITETFKLNKNVLNS